MKVFLTFNVIPHMAPMMWNNIMFLTHFIWILIAINYFFIPKSIHYDI